MKYFDELKRAMEWLSYKEDTYFIGQSVGCPGTAIFNTIKDVNINKRLELPVFEETQMGISIGLSLEGFVPVSIYPRLNFLLCAINELVNHLDKYSIISEYHPKVILRSSVGSVRPLDPQAQHRGDFTNAIKEMCETINVIRLDEPEDIFSSYVEAYNSDKSTLLIEWADFLNEK